jgi:hypothetical protein
MLHFRLFHLDKLRIGKGKRKYEVLKGKASVKYYRRHGTGSPEQWRKAGIKKVGQGARNLGTGG